MFVQLTVNYLLLVDIVYYIHKLPCIIYTSIINTLVIICVGEKNAPRILDDRRICCVFGEGVLFCLPTSSSDLNWGIRTSEGAGT